MDKFLGQEYTDLQDRERYLRDNAETIENLGYNRPIPSERIARLKDVLAEASIKKMELEEEKQAEIQSINNEINGCKKAIKEVALQLKSRTEYVNEPCYKMVDQQERQVGYYNKEGMLVYQRDARQEELQPHLFILHKEMTGTDNL